MGLSTSYVSAKTHFIGPETPVQKQGRNNHKYILSQNETPSLGNLPFPDLRRSSTHDDILNRTPSKGKISIQVSHSELKNLKNTAVQIEKFKESIYLLAQRRVAAFYQQLILAFNTKLHFEEGNTYDQAESAKERELTDGKKSIKLKMDAAHSNTIPCLYAYDLTEWNDYEENQSARQPVDKPQGFVYMKGSEAYRFWNSTIEVPKIFNIGVDNTVDLKEKGLRKAGLALLNQAAIGEISPEDGLKAFISKFQEIVEREMIKAQQKENEGKYHGLKLYQKELSCIVDSLEYDQNVFSHYLNLQVDSSDSANDIRHLIYQIRYKAIQNNFSEQAEIALNIGKVREKIFKQFKRLPSYAEEAFKLLLIDNMEDRNRTCIKKFFAMPYELRENPTRADYIVKARAKIEEVEIPQSSTVRTNQTGLSIIKDLAKELNRTLSTMRANEISARGSTMRTLRRIRKWTQDDLSRRIQRHFPTTPCSKSTISRCETSKRIVDADYATKISYAFKVDPALFIPQFFNA